MTAQSEFIQRMSNVYGEPRVDDPAAYIREVAKAINGYDGSAVAAAGDRVIKTCKFWPRPAEIVEAIEDVLRSRYKVAKPMRAEDPKPIDDAARARVKALTQIAVAALDANRQMGKVIPMGELPKVDRPAFEKMQRESKNGFHIDHQKLMRRITGERD